MNVLVLKKKIIFINCKKSYVMVNTQIRLFYYFIRNKVLLWVYLSNCQLKKNNVMAKSLNYFYTLKWKCTSSFILNSKLNSLLEFFYSVRGLSNFKNINWLSNSKYFVSVIRSPFVYKKSMEQFFYKKYKIYYQTNISTYNFFFHNYQYENLQNALRKKKNLKLFCKITFIFN
jgi:hypothetical protein